MGSIASSTFYIPSEQLSTIASANPFLEEFFISIKNYQGHITSDIFYSKIINKAVEMKISNKIFKLFSDKGKMSYAQLRYYYCALYSMNNQDKIHFICYLIFGTKEGVSLQKYYKKINYFFSQSDTLKKILISNTLIDNICLKGIIAKNDMLFGLRTRNYYTLLNDFFFIKQYSTYENNANSQFEYLCCCENKYEGEKGKKDIQPLYDQMLSQFEKEKGKKGGFYPLASLNQYLLDVNVNNNIVNYIMRYIQKTTMKNFIDYETFYSLISTLPPSNSNKSLEYLFNILSYPNDIIKKNTLIDIIQSIQSNSINSSNNSIISINKPSSDFSQSSISFEAIIKDLPDSITKSQFIAYTEKSHFEGIDDLKNNIDRIRYIPYLFFNITPKDLAIEYACIQNIMGGKTIDQYLKDQMKIEESFYAVTCSFWNNYHVYLSSFGELIKRPIIYNQEICSSSNSSLLNANAVYLRDYCILPAKLYLFIIKLCKKGNHEILIRKISYPKKESNINSTISDLSSEKDGIVTELELFPITVIHSFIYYITLSLDNPSIDKAKEFLSSKQMVNSRNTKQYPKMSKLSEVKRDLMNVYEYNSWETSDLIIFYNGEFIKIPNSNITNMTFDSVNINDVCICLLNTKHETMNYTYYDSMLSQLNNGNSNLVKENNDNFDINNLNNTISNTVVKAARIKGKEERLSPSSSFSLKTYLALDNLKNSCYINSVLQVLYPIPIIKFFIKSKYFAMFINSKSSEEREKLITFQLYKIIMNHKKEMNSSSINKAFFIQPISFVKCIETISNFNRETQEDAGEFFIFIINQIHQEIKMNRELKDKKLNNQYNPNLSDTDNISLIWGREIKNNTSLINSLFLFLSQTTLTCTRCGTENKSCQTSNNLFLPIPKEDNITISIILHRLPFKYKVYYKEMHNALDENKNQNQIVNVLSTIKDNLIDNTININNDKEKLYLSPLATSIPLKLSLTLKQKDKLSTVVSKLRSMIDLDLEQYNELNTSSSMSDDFINVFSTTFILFNEQYDAFLDINKDITSNCCNGDTLHVYELLNSKGINLLKENLFELSLCKSVNTIFTDKNIKIVSYNIQNSISNEKIMQDALMPNNEIQKTIYYEYLIEIKHRYPKTTYPYLFHKTTFYSLGFMPDYLLINNSKANITSMSLYNYIWEKYSYVLPSTSNTLIWWESNSVVKQACYPFVLKLIDANKGVCSFCPWFKLCKGCRIRPSNDNMFIPPRTSIVVEWCYELVKSGQIFINTTLTLVYSKEAQNEIKDINQLYEDKPINESNNSQVKSIYQCLDLWFQKETLDDALMCNKCQSTTIHSKIDRIVRLPKYLVLTLKRFNQMVYASNIKDNSLIDFPIKDLVVNGKSYDLNGVIYHTGSANIGHYYTIIKGVEDKWVSLNDKKITLIENESKIITNQAYILIYEENSKSDASLYNKLMETMVNNWESHQLDDFFFEGEPVKVNNDFGVVKTSFFKNGEYVVKVLLDIGEQDFK